MFFWLSLLALTATVTADQKCGQTPVPPNLDTSAKIVGGTVAVKYSWPWQIAFMVNTSYFVGLDCGATVLSEKWVLTAGHCVFDFLATPEVITLKTGVYDEKHLHEPGETVHGVKAIHIHPEYDDVRILNDIALFELADEIVFTDHVQPICLSSNDSDAVVEPNTAWAVGWGHQKVGDHHQTRKLRQVNVPIVNFDTCASEYPSSLDEEMNFCAGKGGKDSCQGDSGGPLLAQKNGVWYQYGVTSWGYGCGDERYAGIYTRVTSYCDFIKTTTNGEVQCVDPES